MVGSFNEGNYRFPLLKRDKFVPIKKLGYNETTLVVLRIPKLNHMNAKLKINRPHIWRSASIKKPSVFQGPRPGEIDGKDYHFSTLAEMEEMKENGEFIEFAQFSGNMYGTSRKAVQDILDNGEKRAKLYFELLIMK